MALLILIGLLVLWTCAHPVGRRFWSGQHLDGIRRSDGDFWHAGTNATDMSRYVSPWARLAGWQRLCHRIAGIFLLVAFVASYLADPRRTQVIALAALAALLAVGLYYAAKRMRQSGLVKALHARLGKTVALDSGVRPDEWIEAGAKRYTFNMPADFAGTKPARTNAAEVATSGLEGDWSPAWTNAPDGTAVMTLEYEPPPADEVDFAALLPHFEAASLAELVLGLGARGAPMVLEIDRDTPHVLLSMRTGAGKSIALRTLGAQVLHRGWQLVIVDHKHKSHEWAHGLPGVTYCTDASQTYTVLNDLWREVDKRNQQAGEIADELRIVVIVEELNTTMAQLARFEKGKPQSAVESFQSLLAIGRQARVNLLICAQMGTAQAFGGTAGGAARENVGARIMGRWTDNAWEMLVPEVKPIPRASPIPGRVRVIVGEVNPDGEAESELVQIGYMSKAQAIEYATTGLGEWA